MKNSGGVPLKISGEEHNHQLKSGDEVTIPFTSRFIEIKYNQSTCKCILIMMDDI